MQDACERCHAPFKQFDRCSFDLNGTMRAVCRACWLTLARDPTSWAAFAYDGDSESQEYAYHMPDRTMEAQR